MASQQQQQHRALGDDALQQAKNAMQLLGSLSEVVLHQEVHDEPPLTGEGGGTSRRAAAAPQPPR